MKLSDYCKTYYDRLSSHPACNPVTRFPIIETMRESMVFTSLLDVRGEGGPPPVSFHDCFCLLTFFATLHFMFDHLSCKLAELRKPSVALELNNLSTSRHACILALLK